MVESLSNWLQSTRPKTLVASLIPVSVAGAKFYHDTHEFPFLLFVLCLLFAALVQIGCNLANDYFDCKSGSDRCRDLGPDRMVNLGKISASSMRLAYRLVLSSAFAIGLVIFILSESSSWVLLFGVVAIFFAYAYTGGPFPLAYNCLGDPCVILFFGFGAFEGTGYVMGVAGGYEWQISWSIGLALGLVINNLLVLNNYRDFESDRKARKITLVVLLGKKFGELQFLLGIIYSTLALPFINDRFWLVSLAFPPFAFAFFMMRRAKSKDSFGKVLGLTAFSVLLFGSLLAFDYLL